MTDTPDAGPLDAAQVKLEAIAPGDRFAHSLGGFASFCETHERTGGITAGDLSMLAGKFRDAAFVVEQLQKRAADAETAAAALSQQLSDARAWKPIETYDREKGETATLLDWFTYRSDPDKKTNPVRYVGEWSAEHEAWFDDDGMDLDIEPTHWLPLPNVPEGGR